jgi:DNA-binding transcriptional MocR family regulator
MAAHTWLSAVPDAGSGLPNSETGQMPGDSADLIEMSVNYPASDFLAGALLPGLAAIGADTARLTDLAGYQPSAGRLEHRAAGAHWLARFGLDATADEIVPVHGTQGGLTVVLSTLVAPGETLLVEDLTWPGVHRIAIRYGLTLVPVGRDEEGLCPDALARAARQTGARAAYLMPTLHNPLNTIMPDARRDALIAVARSENLILVEDDIYGFLADHPPAPLAARDPDRAVYVTSLSKCVAPGLRFGFVKAPHALVPRLAQAVAVDTIMVSPLLAEIATQLIESGHADVCAEAQRTEALKRQALARRLLPLRLPAGSEASFHIWLPMPEGWRSERFVTEARAQGVVLTPGSTFHVDGGDPGAVRLCLPAAPDHTRLEAGLKIIAGLLTHAPHQPVMPMV